MSPYPVQHLFRAFLDGAGGSCLEIRAEVMTRLPLFSSPLVLGFEALEQMLDEAAKSPSDGYPPYNIERSSADAGGAEFYRVSLAVAGFDKGDIEITVEDRQLMIRGRQKEEAARDYLHRGIAARQFARTFLLADGMDVTEARLENGLLAIDLRKSAPERVVRRIGIK
jgi:HSP20 family molecular chaperone IbpA